MLLHVLGRCSYALPFTPRNFHLHCAIGVFHRCSKRERLRSPQRLGFLQVVAVSRLEVKHEHDGKGACALQFVRARIVSGHLQAGSKARRSQQRGRWRCFPGKSGCPKSMRLNTEPGLVKLLTAGAGLRSPVAEGWDVHRHDALKSELPRRAFCNFPDTIAAFAAGCDNGKRQKDGR